MSFSQWCWDPRRSEISFKFRQRWLHDFWPTLAFIVSLEIGVNVRNSDNYLGCGHDGQFLAHHHQWSNQGWKKIWLFFALCKLGVFQPKNMQNQWHLKRQIILIHSISNIVNIFPFTQWWYFPWHRSDILGRDSLCFYQRLDHAHLGKKRNNVNNFLCVSMNLYWLFFQPHCNIQKFDEMNNKQDIEI